MSPSPQVRDAVFRIDTAELSRLGKKGAETKKAKREARLKRLLAEAEQKLREANEDICPVD